MIEIHALSGAYAVDALDDIERAQFERHLAECAECRAEVASLRDTASLLAGTSATAPPQALRDRVLADIATVRPLPPAVRTGGAPRRRFRLAPLAAAAALIAAVGTGVIATQPWSDDSSQTQVSAVDRVLRADDREEVTGKLSNGGSATVVRSESQNAAVVIAKEMAPLPTNRVYQLWFQDSAGNMVSAGLMEDPAATATLLDGDAATARAAAVSIEPAGGSEQPTADRVVGFFKFQQA